jgi:hypothetical protein
VFRAPHSLFHCSTSQSNRTFADKRQFPHGQETEFIPRFAASPPRPSSAFTNQDTAKNEEKAALLRAKLLEKRANSRGPMPGQGFSKPPAANIDKITAEESLETNSAIDSLVREAREAADREAQAKQSTDSWMNPDRLKLIDSNVNKSDNKISTGPASKLVEPANPQSGKKYKPKETFKSRTLDNRKAENQLAKSVADTENMNNSAFSNPNKSATQSAASVAGSTKEASNINSNQPKRSSGEDGIITTTNQTGKTPSRSDTLLSTSTIQPDIVNKSNILEESDPVLQKEQASDVSNVAVDKGDAASTTALARLDNVPQADFMSNGTDLTLLNASSDVAKYSHHFDDLDEWLEVTGYHDRGNRERVLGLHRRRADLQRQMAEVERELEQSTIHRTRFLQSIPVQNSNAMAPPTTSSACKANVAASLSPTDSVKPASAGASIGGTKRIHSPDRIPTGPAHVDKQRRLSSGVKGMGNTTTTAVIDTPSGPR